VAVRGGDIAVAFDRREFGRRASIVEIVTMEEGECFSVVPGVLLHLYLPPMFSS
jgi:hypothetical protein